MIGYAMLGTNDVARARAFYDPILEMFGAKPMAGWSSETRTFYGAGAGKPLLAVGKPHDGGAANCGNGTMLAFPAETRAIVDAAHAKAVAVGGADEGKPGIRGSDANGFYAAYVRDPDGNKLCFYRIGPA